MKNITKHFISISLVFVLSLVLVSGLPSTGAQPTTKLTDLGSLPGSGSTTANDINNRGQVVGSSSNRAYVWTEKEGMQDLGIESPYSVATAINEKGTIVGFYVRPDDTSMISAFIWTKQQGVQSIDIPSGYNSMAVSINNKDQVAGILRDAQYWICHVFVWSEKDGLIILEGLPEANGVVSVTIAIDGQVIGTLNLPNGGRYPFTWSTTTGIKELSVVFGSSNSLLRDINNKGLIVGGYTPISEYQSRSYIISGGMLVDLGSPAGDLGSQAYSINEKGQIVGTSWTDYFVGRHGYYWDEKTGMKLLDDLPGAIWTDALSINNRGQAIGTCCVVNTDGAKIQHAILWTIG